MDIRNIQRSGSTYYLYLPKAWCMQNSVNPDTKLVLETSSEGDLIVSPHNRKAKQASLQLKLAMHDMRVVNKFIMAAYINPVKSFRIQMDKEISSLDILDQKRLLSGVEIVEIGGNQISCESSIFVDDPDIMLKTMVKKLMNALHIMIKKGENELLTRYEEEIDRSNTLIAKSVVSALTFHRTSKLRNIELYYIAVLSKNLELLADHISALGAEAALAKKCLDLTKLLLKTLDEMSIEAATNFAMETVVIASGMKKAGKEGKFGSLNTALNQCADTIIDWAIMKEIENQNKKE